MSDRAGFRRRSGLVTPLTYVASKCLKKVVQFVDVRLVFPEVAHSVTKEPVEEGDICPRGTLSRGVCPDSVKDNVISYTVRQKNCTILLLQ